MTRQPPQLPPQSKGLFVLCKLAGSASWCTFWLGADQIGLTLSVDSSSTAAVRCQKSGHKSFSCACETDLLYICDFWSPPFKKTHQIKQIIKQYEGRKSQKITQTYNRKSGSEFQNVDFCKSANKASLLTGSWIPACYLEAADRGLSLLFSEHLEDLLNNSVVIIIASKFFNLSPIKVTN